MTEWIHVPTPGDHYSSSTGSAIMTLIYEISRAHASRGGHSRVLVSGGTRRDYPVGETLEVPPTTPPSKWHKVIDLAFGWIGADRPFGTAACRGHLTALSPDFNGVIFVHNDAAAVSQFKGRCPDATVCLWANNDLFGTFGRAERNRVVQEIDRLICCSEFIASRARAELRPDLHDRVVVVHNGVDVERFRPPDAPAMGPPDRAIRRAGATDEGP